MPLSGDDCLTLTQLGADEARKSPTWPMFADLARARIALTNRSHTREGKMRPPLSHLTNASATASAYRRRGRRDAEGLAPAGSVPRPVGGARERRPRSAGQR